MWITMKMERESWEHWKMKMKITRILGIQRETCWVGSRFWETWWSWAILRNQGDKWPRTRAVAKQVPGHRRVQRLRIGRGAAHLTRGETWIVIGDGAPGAPWAVPPWSFLGLELVHHSILQRTSTALSATRPGCSAQQSTRRPSMASARYRRERPHWFLQDDKICERAANPQLGNQYDIPGIYLRTADSDMKTRGIKPYD